jgi:hypothetical protein
MDRSVSDKNILDKFVLDFCKVAEKHAIYIIVSGFVAISSGRARGTEDIDMIIQKLDFEKFGQFHKDLIKNNFVCMQSDNIEEIYSYLKDNLSVRYTYKNKPLPEMEIKFTKDELDEIQLKNRTKLEITGLNIWFGSINMNIAFKEELLKSDKDMEDARHLRIVYSELIDEKEINKFKELIRKKRYAR